MALLASALYDPTTAVTNKATTAALAMTAVDTSNLRLTFTAPANGKVRVRVKCQVHGATTFPQLLLGVLESATVKARIAPLGQPLNALATQVLGQEATGIVSGLTPGNNYTWDAAYGVETLVAATNIKYGGPDNASGANAYGGFLFEVWETPGLLGSVLYDPAGAVTKSTTGLLAMTAIDTTNARITFAAPPSGKILWRAAVPIHGSTTTGQILLGVMDGATVKGRVAPGSAFPNAAAATSFMVQEGSGTVTGLTPGNTYNYDLAYGVQVVSGAGGIKYGGPNDTTANNAFGALAYEIWRA